MLVSSPPPDTTPEIHQLKRRGCLGGHSFRLDPCTGNWPSCFIQVLDEELHHDETHEKQRPSLYGSQNPKTKKKRKVGFQCPFPQHTRNDLTQRGEEATNDKDWPLGFKENSYILTQKVQHEAVGRS